MEVIRVCILAAGQSRRMGQNKLHLPWQRQRTLLEQALCTYKEGCQKALETMERAVRFQYVAVVAQGDRKAQKVAGTYGYQLVLNTQIDLGQSYSLRLAIEEATPGTVGFLIGLADQPMLQSLTVARAVQDFMQVRRKNKEPNKTIIRSVFGPDRQLGHPLLMGVYWKSFLKQIEGDKGARHLLQEAGAPYIHYCQGLTEEGIDLDSPATYTYWLSLRQSRRHT